MLSVLDIQILQLKLHKASMSGMLYCKQVALDYYLTKASMLRQRHDSMFAHVAIEHGTQATCLKFRVVELSEIDVDFHIETAQRILSEELSTRIAEINVYQGAEDALFNITRHYHSNQVLYESQEKGCSLTVDQMLRVAKYATAVAEIIEPDNPNYEHASAAITVFQGIEAVLENRNHPVPIGKKLHVANGFLTTVVKSCVKDKDTKRGITVTSTLIDLAIDFFCRN